MNLLFIILSIASFLRTVGIIVVSYYVLKFVGRLLFPIVVKKAVNNMQARQQTYAERKPEGQVTVERKHGDHQQPRYNQGEYVDFEEVD